MLGLHSLKNILVMTHDCLSVSNHQQLNCMLNSLFYVLPKIWMKFHWSFFLSVQMPIYFSTWYPITWWYCHMEKLSALLAISMEKGIHWSLVDSPYKGPIMRITVPCHGIVMTVICWQMLSEGCLNGFCISCSVKYHQLSPQGKHITRSWLHTSPITNGLIGPTWY